MLLTSSQVSVAVSSGIIFFFTAALFLSGYVIQQRTLRDLRAAIKPKPSPKIILQEQFRKPQDVLMDGKHEGSSGSDGPQDVTVEISPTLPDDVANQKAVPGPETKPQQEPESDKAEPEEPEKPISRAERRKRIKEEIQKLSQGQERGYYQRRLW